MKRDTDKIEKFLSACDELIEEKIVSGDRAFAGVLRAIAESKELTELFTAVTERFDYTGAKRELLRFPSAPGASHGAAFLPKERGDVLAFVFCLLVDFDEGNLSFRDFLLRYFYVDGSYTGSYAMFADKMLRPFREIVSDCYPAANRQVRITRTEEKERSAADGIVSLAEKELARVKGLPLGEGDKNAGVCILEQLLTAAARKDFPAVKALSCGYVYFLSVTKAGSETSDALFALAEKL